jgi:hypothetical protein
MKIAILKLSYLCILLIGCSSKDTVPEPIIATVEITPEGNSNSDYSILFVGNSLTATNDLPKLVRDRAIQNDISIQTTKVTYGNYGLEDHWNDGDIQTLIEANNYDFVVIQQGPSSQAYGRSSLIEYGGYIKEICEANNTQLAFFMVWPSLEYYYTFDGVIQNYTDAANLNNAILCPVGVHWRNAVDQNEDYSYYGPDGFHPSLEGSEVAAQVILEGLGVL